MYRQPHLMLPRASSTQRSGGSARLDPNTAEVKADVRQSKYRPEQLTQLRDAHRSAHRRQPVRKSAQPGRNFAPSLAPTSSSSPEGSPVVSLSSTSTSSSSPRFKTFAELRPLRSRAPGHPWGWRPQPGWICSGSCGRRGSWSSWCSSRSHCFRCRSSTPPAWVHTWTTVAQRLPLALLILLLLLA